MRAPQIRWLDETCALIGYSSRVKLKCLRQCLGLCLRCGGVGVWDPKRQALAENDEATLRRVLGEPYLVLTAMVCHKGEATFLSFLNEVYPHPVSQNVTMLPSVLT